jgi:hypothetical protein
MATLVGCGEATTTAGRSQLEDASASTGGSRGTGGSSSGTGGAADASTDGGLCDDGIVFNVARSRGAESFIEAGPPSLIQLVEGGFVHVLPTDPCVTYLRRDCPGAPRSVFGCPNVVGPSARGIHPGDEITVTVPIADDALDGYSCFGLAPPQGLPLDSELAYTVSPGYVKVSGRIPASAKSGTVYHFTAEASGSRYTSGSACERDLTTTDFDVKVE